MADLSTDDQQSPSIDDLVNAVGDLSAPAAYVPPRSGTFRTSKYPGFYGSATGAAPSNNPNPVAGDNPVALPPANGDDADTPPLAQQSSGLGSVTSNPVETSPDPGEGAANRAADAEETGRQVGYDTDPDDALKSLNIATSVLGGGTGLIGLGADEAASALGINPSDSIYGGGSSFDMKANKNRQPGWDDAYDAALDGAHAQGYNGLPAANRAAQTAAANLDYNGEGRPNPQPGVNQGIAATPTPRVTDVTALNRQTGFQRPASPSDRTAAPQNPGDVGTAASAPAGAPSPPTPAGVGHPQNSGNGGANRGGGNGGGLGGFGHDQAGNSNAARRGFKTGGVVTKNAMQPHHKAAAHKNHQILKQVAAKTGKTVPAIVAMHKNSSDDIGARARLEAHVMKLACGGKVKKYAVGGAVTDGDAPAADQAADPTQSAQYNPPADQTAGNSDTVPAKLTPGEMVITKPAASQYDPEVLAAMNDPSIAAEINDRIEQFLSDQSGQGDDSAGPDDADDEADSDDAPDDSEDSDDASGLGSMAPMRGIPSPKSKLASVTRAA